MQQKLAIATLWDGVPDYACAILHYCQRAQLLADIIVSGVGSLSADLLMMLTNDHVYETSRQQCRCTRAGRKFCPQCPSRPLMDEEFRPRRVLETDCPQMKIHTVDKRLKEAVDAYANSPTGGCRARWQTTVLYKWWAMSLIEYSLIILADLDVQLLRPEQPTSFVAARWKRTWSDAVPGDGRPRVYSEGDHWTPFNGGLWTLGHPTQSLYEDGLALLRRGKWNTTHGFNYAGTPREYFARLPSLRKRMKHTTMYRKNTWNIPFGDCDQGFLFYMFYLHFPRDGGSPIGSARYHLDR